MEMNTYRVGIDLGGTKIEAVLLDSRGGECHRHRISTPRGGTPEQEYRAICEAVIDLINHTAATISGPTPYSVGIGIPGTINALTGLVQNANTTCLIGQPFQKDLEQRLGRFIGMENDANCFTLAEALSGAGKGYNLVFGIILGTGCGGGISINGRLHRGRHLIAGEWGHFSVDPNGADCWCGNRGCVETKISGGGMTRAFAAQFGHPLTMEQIVQGYRRADPDCRLAVSRFLDDFGRCVGGIISLLDPDAVILGGGLSNIDELYTLGLERVRRYAFHACVQTPILKNALGDSAGVIGAAWIGR
jgi:fructokinase